MSTKTNIPFLSTAQVKTFKEDYLPIPKMDKLLGLKQLTALSYKGSKNYSTGRAFSPSSLKEMYTGNGLSYLDYVTKRQPTKNERLAEFYDKKKQHLTIGIVFEDLLCYGFNGYDEKYEVMDDDIISASARYAAHKRGARCIRRSVADLVEWMCVECRGNEVAKDIEGGEFQVSAACEVDMGGYPIKLNGFIDAVNGKKGIEIKTCDSLTDAEDRIFKHWSNFQYWMQGAVYHAAHDFDEFTYFFVSKRDPYMSLSITIEKPELDNLLDQFKRLVLVPAMHYMEYGFETTAPRLGKLKPVKVRKMLNV